MTETEMMVTELMGIVSRHREREDALLESVAKLAVKSEQLEARITELESELAQLRSVEAGDSFLPT